MARINYNEEDVVSHHAVAAVLKDSKGRILMQEHLKYGFWTLPVGKVKQGQEIEAGLRDELREECNLEVGKFRELRSRRYVYRRGGKRVLVLGHLFEVLSYTGAMRNNEPQKHARQLFLSLARIRRLPYLSDVTLLYLDILGLGRKARLAAR